MGGVEELSTGVIRIKLGALRSGRAGSHRRSGRAGIYFRGGVEMVAVKPGGGHGTDAFSNPVP